MVQMTPEPNLEDMSFKQFTVNEHSTMNPEVDLDTNFLKVFLPLIQNKCREQNQDICRQYRFRILQRSSSSHKKYEKKLFKNSRKFSIIL